MLLANVCFRCVKFSVFSTNEANRLAGKDVSKMTYFLLRRVGSKTLTQYAILSWKSLLAKFKKISASERHTWL